jgi:glycosyltransferase involved in cell wall biosynthesis
LERAIRSVATQEGAQSDIVVVANGPSVDFEALHNLEVQFPIRVAYLGEGNLPRALHLGRSLVTTAYFGFLDDDDELLPSSISRRTEVLSANPLIDFVVTNGVRCHDGVDSAQVVRPNLVTKDPLGALVSENWMASCGGLFRSASIDISLFVDVPMFYEWTYLAFRLAASRKMQFIDELTYRIYDSQNSLSKSDAYRRAIVPALKRILALPLDSRIRRELRRKLGAAHHDLSSYFLARGEFRNAWMHHLKSLVLPMGIQYLLFSRRLVGGRDEHGGDNS